MTIHNTRFVLARRPSGWVTEEDFRLERVDVAPIAEGQVLIANRFLSLDPYMRGRMNDARSYAPKVELGDVMIGGAVGEVIESRHATLRVGDKVVGSFGWQTHAVGDGAGVQPLRATDLPLSYALGVLGMPGVTAWMGTFDIARLARGETLVVSAASGAVGSVVGQIAKEAGARVVGIAGGAVKCRYVVEELGFDACVDYRAETFRDELARATPSGVDVDFENVGGEVMDGVLSRLNPHARVALCGLVSQYNEASPRGIRNVSALLTNRVRLEGFIVTDRLDLWPNALVELTKRVRAGTLKTHESIVEGLENAPRAFIGMLRGDNLGKQLVKVS